MSAPLLSPGDLPAPQPFWGALLRQPPHDPTWIPLDPRAGWRAAELTRVEVQGGSGALALAPALGSGRRPAEATGSFGGARLPNNLAQAADGTLYLLDRTSLRVRRFDRCECAFATVPCYGGPGSGPRQLQDAAALAICGGNLFVADTLNHRVVVIALKGFVVRALWTAPIRPELPAPWEPVDVAVDGRGRLHVADRANRAVHVFSPAGTWIRWTALPAAPRFVAIDCADLMFVVLDGESHARVFEKDGRPAADVIRPQQVAASFPPAPLPSNSRGDVDVSLLCCEPSGTRWVDASGASLDAPPPPEPPQYEKSGDYLSLALDSRLFRCQWHRVILDGVAPRGSNVVVSTYTTEADVPYEFVRDLDESAWQTRQTFRGSERGWDALVRSGPGRFLWLRLAFSGNGAVTPVVRAARVEFPRISLRRYLPAVFAEDPSVSDFTDRFLSVFDTTLRGIERQIDDQARYFGAESAPAEPIGNSRVDFLSFLASWVGIHLDRAIPEARRRALLLNLGRSFPIRGTRTAIHRALLVFLGLRPRTICGTRCEPGRSCTPEPRNCRPEPPCTYDWADPPLLLEHYKIRRWLFLGAGRLGDEAKLWGERIVGRLRAGRGAEIGASRIDTTPDPLHDPFLVYAHKFTAFVPAQAGRDAGQRRALTNLLLAESPAHTQFHIEFVEPRLRIGVQSTIGFDAVVGRYPSGVVLGTTALGPASVLDGSPEARGGPSMRIGADARIGTTTRLE